jgi:hypothetical protein
MAASFQDIAKKIFVAFVVAYLVLGVGMGYYPDYWTWYLGFGRLGPHYTDDALFEEPYPGSKLQYANFAPLNNNYKIDKAENYGSKANQNLSKMAEMMEPYAFYSENEKYGANNKSLQSVLEKYDSYGGVNNAALASVLSKDFFDYYDEKENFKNNNRALQTTLLTDLPPF